MRNTMRPKKPPTLLRGLFFLTLVCAVCLAGAGETGYHLSNEVPPGFGVDGVALRIELDLNRSLRRRQQEQLQRDQALRDAIRTKEDLEAYKKKVRENFQAILGPWPERIPLNPVKVGTLKRDGYRVEKILIESQPGFHVPINLYVPTGREGPMPAVLSPLGHAPMGKAHDVNDNYQARFIALARKGYVVCAYDPLGQGEREPYGAKTGNHHYIQGYQCMPSGRHLASYFIWDGIRCIDYLETRPEVDPKRIACSGCSGGGALTQYISTVDDRVAVSVPASWITDSIALTEDGGLHTESWFPDMCAPHGPGTRQLLACIAPRPLLIIGNRDDAEFPPEAMAAVYRDIKKLYQAIGLSERVEYVNVPTKHGFWPEARRELYRFLNKRLDNTEAGLDEPPSKTEAEEELFCAPRGQVRNLPGAQTVHALNRTVMAELAKQRSRRRRDLGAYEYAKVVRQGVINATLYRPASGKPTVQIGKRETQGNVSRTQMVLEYEDGFWTAAKLWEPAEPVTPLTIVLVADDNERAEQLASQLADRGLRVLHPRTRATNDRCAIMAGMTRSGRWMRLLARGADFVRSGNDRKATPVVALGVGPAASLAAQCVAVVEPDKFSAIAAMRGLDRIESLADGIAESHSIEMLPGALRWFDETDLPAVLAPKPVLLADIRDKHGDPLDADQLATLYAWPSSRYEKRESRAFRLESRDLRVAELVDWLVKQPNRGKRP